MQLNRKSALIIAGTMACISHTAFASRFDVLSGRTGGPANGGSTCRSCHGSNVGDGSIEILNAPSQYQANGVYDITVRISDVGQAGAGFQLSAEDASGNHLGAFTVLDAVKTELNPDDNNYINHTPDGVDDAVANWAANSSSASYTVRWTAPSTDLGTVTFWAAGNAINNNFSASGDFIYTTSKSASFVAVPAASTWGLIVLTLCVLTAGTLVGLRRGARLIPVTNR